MSPACVATEDTVAYTVDTLAVERRAGVDITVAHASNRGDELEGRARRVGELYCAVEPSAAFVDCLKGSAWYKRAQVVDVIGWMADQSEHFTGLNIESDGSSRALTECNFGSLLQVNINTGDKAVTLLGGNHFKERVLKTKRIHTPNFHSGSAGEPIIEGALESGFPDLGFKGKCFDAIAGNVAGVGQCVLHIAQ